MRGPPEMLRISAPPRPLRGAFGVPDGASRRLLPARRPRRGGRLNDGGTDVLFRPSTCFVRPLPRSSSATSKSSSDPTGLDAVVERFVSAELGEFVWDGRVAERDLGAYQSLDDDEFEGSGRVRTLSIFCGRYRVATCIVDRSRRLQMMLAINDFDDLPSAEIAFRNDG